MIITIGGTKGGGGKTTLAVNLAVTRALAGYDVLLVDADDQGTASDFTSLRAASLDGNAGYTSVRLLGEELLNIKRSLRDKYDDIIIDAGGRDTDSHRAGLGIADIALIPFEPSSFDVWTVGKVSKIVREMRTVNPNLRAYTLLNKAETVGHDNEEAAEAVEGVEELEYIPSPIKRRKAFKRAAAQGRSVMDVKPADARAQKELMTIYDFTFGKTEEIKEVANG